MKLDEAQNILDDNNAKYRIDFGDMTPKIFYKEQTIYFTEDKAYIENTAYDNCPECGSPTNMRREAQEITKEDLKKSTDSQL